MAVAARAASSCATKTSEGAYRRGESVTATESAPTILPAQRIGTVGGDKLAIKTGAGECSWDLRELHDLWWNSIARAMS